MVSKKFKGPKILVDYINSHKRCDRKTYDKNLINELIQQQTERDWPEYFVFPFSLDTKIEAKMLKKNILVSDKLFPLDKFAFISSVYYSWFRHHIYR